MEMTVELCTAVKPHNTAALFVIMALIGAASVRGPFSLMHMTMFPEWMDDF